MDTLLHLGLEHPSLLWLVAASIVAFAAGLGVRLHRTRRRDDLDADTTAVDDTG
jgi:hypothetical protein